jgi:MFS family permease
VACAAWGFAPNEPVYFICLAVANVGGMAFAYIANLNVISNWFPRKKGIAMGLVTIGFPVSVIITVPLLSKLLSVGGLPAVYLTYAAALLVLGLICIIFVRDYPEQVGAFPDNDKRYDKETALKNLQEGLEYMKTSQWKPGKVFKTKQSWQIAISLGIAELLSLGIMTNFVPRCLQSGFEMGLIMQMLIISGFLACVGSYVAGVIDAHIGPKKTSVIVLLVGVVAIILNLTNIVPLMFVSLAFLGFMLGGASNCLVSIANTVWGRYDFPMAYKVLKPLVAILGAVGVGLVGIIGHQVSYFAAYIVLAILALIGAFIMSRVDDRLIGRSL